MRHLATISIAAVLLAACGGGAGSTSGATDAATGSTAPTSAPAATRPTDAAASPTLIPGCVPQCQAPGNVLPGAITGVYTTRHFFGGRLTVTVPDGWYGYEDSPGRLSFGPRVAGDTRLELWIDVYAATDPSGARDPGVDPAAAAMTAHWLANPGITVISHGPARLGSVEGVAYEYRRNEAATTQDSTCPPAYAPCVVEFGFPTWQRAFEEGAPFRSRLLIASAVWGGATHVLYASFSAHDQAQYDQYAASALAMVEGAQLPDGVTTAPAAP